VFGVSVEINKNGLNKKVASGGYGNVLPAQGFGKLTKPNV
jgi:hypothetical protein